MRKYFIKDFNNTTRYMSLKRYRDNNFYIKCLTIYVEEKAYELH